MESYARFRVVIRSQAEPLARAITFVRVGGLAMGEESRAFANLDLMESYDIDFSRVPQA